MFSVILAVICHLNGECVKSAYSVLSVGVSWFRGRGGIEALLIWGVALLLPAVQLHTNPHTHTIQLTQLNIIITHSDVLKSVETAKHLGKSTFTY